MKKLLDNEVVLFDWNTPRRRDETADGQTHKYAQVVKVHEGADGMVRSKDIEYKLPGRR
jgi:hypothetical protein